MDLLLEFFVCLFDKKFFLLLWNIALLIYFREKFECRLVGCRDKLIFIQPK